MLETVENCKTYLGITGSGDDAVLDMIALDVDAQIKAYIGYGLEIATIEREYHTTSGETNIFTVDYPPIVSGDTLEIFDDNESTTPIDTDWYKVDEQSGTITFINVIPSNSVGELSFTYTGGYAEIPQDIKMVFRQMVRDTYYGRKRESSVTQKRLGDYSVTYKGGDSGQSVDPVEPYKATLDKYKKYAF
jgi:hypothetical protein